MSLAGCPAPGKGPGAGAEKNPGLGPGGDPALGAPRGRPRENLGDRGPHISYETPAPLDGKKLSLPAAFFSWPWGGFRAIHQLQDGHGGPIAQPQPRWMIRV